MEDATAARVRALLELTASHGLSVEHLRLPDGTELWLRAAVTVPGAPTAPSPEPRRPDESDDAYAARSVDARRRAEREAAVKRYARELGSRARAEAYVDRCLAAPGGIVP